MKSAKIIILLCFMALPHDVMTHSKGTMPPSKATEAWTWLYKKIVVVNNELSKREPQSAVHFCNEETSPFTQLVFSWNAFRPKQGFFLFLGRVRDAKTKQWGSWHKMMAWGAGVQRSFYDNSTGLSTYSHVRLETGDKHADSFHIKVIPQEGATLTDLKAIFVSLSDFTKFKPEKIERHGLQIPSIIINNVPKISQLALNHPKNNSLCSTTSCSMLLSYLLGQDVDPLECAENSFDTGLGVYGSWPFNMAHAFERCDGEFLFATARLNTFLGLYQRLQQGIPVVVSVRGYLAGAPKVYSHGHLLMVIGFDAEHQRVVCHDPAFASDDKVFTSYPVKGFLAAWERSHRLAYLAEPITN